MISNCIPELTNKSGKRHKNKQRMWEVSHMKVGGIGEAAIMLQIPTDSTSSSPTIFA